MVAQRSEVCQIKCGKTVSGWWAGSKKASKAERKKKHVTYHIHSRERILLRIINTTLTGKKKLNSVSILHNEES